MKNLERPEGAASDASEREVLLVLKPFGHISPPWCACGYNAGWRGVGAGGVAGGDAATGSRRVALCLLLPPGWEGSLTPDPMLLYAAVIAWFLALFTVRRQGIVQDDAGPCAVFGHNGVYSNSRAG